MAIGLFGMGGRGQGTFYLRNIRWKYISDQTHIAEVAGTNQPSLLEAGPNPFNGSTVLRYAIQKDGLYSMGIYNALGQHVKTIFTSWHRVGSYETQWDGRDGENKQLGSEVYLARLTSGNRETEITAKLIHLQ